MAKKNNPKAEKAKRNLEYARLHKKKARPFGRGGRPGGPRFGEPRPPMGEGRPADRPVGEPVARSSEAAPASVSVPSA